MFCVEILRCYLYMASGRLTFYFFFCTELVPLLVWADRWRCEAPRCQRSKSCNDMVLFWGLIENYWRSEFNGHLGYTSITGFGQVLLYLLQSILRKSINCSNKVNWHINDVWKCTKFRWHVERIYNSLFQSYDVAYIVYTE